MNKEVIQLIMEMNDQNKVKPVNELHRAHQEGFDEATRFWKQRLEEIILNMK